VKALGVLAVLAVLFGCGEHTAGEELQNSPSAAAGGDETTPGQEAARTADPVHPAFDLTLVRVGCLVADEPPEVQEAVAARPEYFLELLYQALALPEDALLLVDKDHPLPADYEPDDLVPLSSYDLTLWGPGHKLRRRIMPDLLAMVEAARADGVELPISSTYRSYSYQAGLYERNVQELGKEQADRESAQPGKSQHQLGTAIDFGSITDAFAHTDAGQWLFRNAWKYGFSLSYPDGYEELTGYRHESWHYRHITRPGARLEREFFGGVQQRLLEFMQVKGHVLHDALVKPLPG
jgi:zinc D-Ala-D-Ala carboxypeptidase